MTNKPKLNQPDVEPTTTLPNITIEKEKNLELIKQLGIELTSLTPQPSKLEQCIKEWEERGWKVEIRESAINIDYMKFGRISGILIYKAIKEVRILYENLHYEEFHLLSKTLKALEEMKDDNI